MKYLLTPESKFHINKDSYLADKFVRDGNTVAICSGNEFHVPTATQFDLGDPDPEDEGSRLVDDAGRIYLSEDMSHYVIYGASHGCGLRDYRIDFRGQTRDVISQITGIRTEIGRSD